MITEIGFSGNFVVHITQLAIFHEFDSAQRAELFPLLVSLPNVIRRKRLGSIFSSLSPNHHHPCKERKSFWPDVSVIFVSARSAKLDYAPPCTQPFLLLTTPSYLFPYTIFSNDENKCARPTAYFLLLAV